MTVRVRTLVATGDSFTEGLEDELGPGGRHLGWADRVAAALAVREGGIRYANLAVRGRLLDQVAAEQLPVALELAPDPAATVVTITNDDPPPGQLQLVDAELEVAESDGVALLVVSRTGGTNGPISRSGPSRRFMKMPDGSTCRAICGRRSSTSNCRRSSASNGRPAGTTSRLVSNEMALLALISGTSGTAIDPSSCW